MGTATEKKGSKARRENLEKSGCKRGSGDAGQDSDTNGDKRKRKGRAN